MDPDFQDVPHPRSTATGARAPKFADGQGEPDGPSFLPPMRRRSRSERHAARAAEAAAALSMPMPPMQPMPQVQPKPRPQPQPRTARAQRKVEPLRLFPFGRPEAPAPSGWMTDAEQLAAAGAGATVMGSDWTRSITRPGQLSPSGQPGFAPPPLRRPGSSRWLRPGFPWLAPRSIALLAALVLLASVAGIASELFARRATMTATAMPVREEQLRQLLGQLEECRGIESLLVMLPNGPERDATLLRLQRQQGLVDTWMRDHSAWMTAAFGAQAAAELRAANGAWRGLQQQVVEAEVEQGPTGLARESRQLLTGPSAAAYRRVVQVVEGMAKRQPS